MFLNPEIIAATTNRLGRAQGPLLQKPAIHGPVQMPPERLARVRNYIDENRSPVDTAAFERAIGTNDLLSLYYFWGAYAPPGPWDEF